ncbi:hypothetical protein JH308_07840 [Xanthomonas campestris pv. campestris]|uniref:hypothetical protein n=1 Tax=Xanthomonas campestris TaxID=339 RepID=UPI0023792FDC|nr:hypothetical protein [Xanthomonas campestris]WDK51178.1 hypothetical protein JH308_07840 [Xanthomonas campestris pv. campestris]WDK52576.1 hypothetical protein JH267_13310 [Xanthomonas campestris pv. campestris]WDL61402.1 hypothetical protein JH259_13245 [Xanthomonas campestris pv. campestris]
MPIQILFDGSVAKHLDAPETNEDAYRLAAASGRIVLSDGASESFDAKNWAALLVDQFLEHPANLSDAIATSTRQYEALHDAPNLSWSKAAAYERGSFGTLLVAQDEAEQLQIRVTAIGDSFAALTDGEQMLACAPYESSEQFSLHPTLISTKPDLNAPLFEDGSGVWTEVVWPYETHGYRLLLCMTDALAAWLLEHQERSDPTALERLHAVRELEELVSLVEEERTKGSMRRDDTTLIIAALTGAGHL